MMVVLMAFSTERADKAHRLCVAWRRAARGVASRHGGRLETRRTRGYGGAFCGVGVVENVVTNTLPPDACADSAAHRRLYSRVSTGSTIYRRSLICSTVSSCHPRPPASSVWQKSHDYACLPVCHNSAACTPALVAGTRWVVLVCSIGIWDIDW